MADSDPAVSAGCLLQHQQSPRCHRECKPWVSRAAVVLPLLGGGRSIDAVTAALSQAMASPSVQVIQETSGLLCEGGSEGNQYIPDSQRLSYPKVHLVSTGELAIRLFHPVPLMNNSYRCSNFI